MVGMCACALACMCVDITECLLELSLPSPFLPRCLTPPHYLVGPQAPRTLTKPEIIKFRGLPEDIVAFPPCQDSELQET